MNKHGAGKAALLAALMSMGTALALGAQAQATGPEAVPGEILVSVRPAAFEGQHLRAMARNVGDIAGAQSALHAVRLRLQPGVRLTDALAQLRQRSDVLYAEPNYIVHLLAMPNDPFYATYQYAPQITQTDKAWDLWTPHAQAIIAIVDTGIDTTHPDLTNKIDRDAQGNVVGYDFIHSTAGAEDDNGHGTHCAGIAAAQTDSGIGIAGVAAWNGAAGQTDTHSIKLMPVKVMDSGGSGTEAGIAEGIIWAADHGAKVISLSMGGPQDSQTLENAVTYAWNKGCLICAAAGNSGTSALSYPAACAHVLSVAATDSTDTIAPYSNYGSWVRVAAPGTQIASTWIGGQYAIATGTSMACPFVAGEAALVWSAVPTLSNDKLGGLLTASVDAFSPAQGHTLAAGAGRVNVYKAMLAALNTTTAPTTTPAPPAPTAVPLAAAAFSAGSVKGGQSVQLTVSLAAPAPVGGETVLLTSSGGLSVPAQVVLPAGKIGFVVTETSSPVRQATTITVTASGGGIKKTATLTVLPPVVRTFAVSATQVTGGSSLTGTVILDGPAPTGGFSIPVGSSSPSVTPPSSVTVPAGSASVTFLIATHAVSVAATITLTAQASATVKLAVAPAPKRH